MKSRQQWIDEVIELCDKDAKTHPGECRCIHCQCLIEKGEKPGNLEELEHERN